MAETQTYYISITGLRLKKPWSFFRFWWLAIRAMMQAQKSPGLISAEAKKISGIHHTRTVWISKEAMRDYMTSGSHLQAMRDFSKVATGSTFGYFSSTVPSWAEVHKTWLEKGVPYSKN